MLTITPGEAAVIAADAATKASAVELAFVDRFSGSLLIVGRLADVEAAVRGVVDTLETVLGFTPAQCPDFQRPQNIAGDQVVVVNILCPHPEVHICGECSQIGRRIVELDEPFVIG